MSRGRFPWSSVALAFFTVVSLAVGDVHYADLNSPSPTPPYTNWLTAAHGVEQAVDASSPGDEVLVNDGVYVLTNTLLIDKGVSCRSVNGALATVVDAQGRWRALTLENRYAVIDGFTFSAGKADSGGGILMDPGGLVVNCIIENCTASGVETYGGGAYIVDEGVLRNCVIQNNSAIAQAQWWVDGPQPEELQSFGGGVVLGPGARMENCLVRSNTANSYMATPYLGTKHPHVGTRSSGGGVHGQGTVVNSIIYDNVAGIGDDLTNDRALDVSHSLGTGLFYGEGNIASEPLVVSINGWPQFLPGSICINAGTNLDWMAAGTDLRGRPRLVETTVDIGPCEQGGADLICNMTCSVTDGAGPLVVALQAHVMGTNTDGLVYSWDFDGDSLIDTQGVALASVTYEYSACGTYPATLSVSNSAGETAQQVLAPGIHVGPADVFVANEGGHIYPFADWASAATNIQTAVDVAPEGGTVWLTNGFYYVTTNIIVDRGLTLRSLNGKDQTFIDGSGMARCLYIDNTNALVEAVTIRDGGHEYRAGGVMMLAGTLRGCIITECSAGHGDSNGEGGGVYCAGLSRVENCEIISNSASFCSGGGVYITDEAWLVNCLVADNWAGRGGGILSEYGGWISRCTITGNECSGDDSGAGLLAIYGGQYRESIIHDNRAGQVLPRSTNNYLIIGSSSFDECYTTPYIEMYNYTNDPLFVSQETGNYRLQSNSPCIDHFYPSEGTDLDGYPRTLIGRPGGDLLADAGCYEYVHPKVDSDNDGQRDVEEIAADTDARDPASCLMIRDASYTANALHLEWQGGVTVTQYVEICESLLDPHWRVVYTNHPPTSLTNVLIDAANTNLQSYYRVRVRTQ